jgi:hypothetical protein
MADRPATVQDLHDTALALPGVTVEQSSGGPVYQVGRKSFLFFRGPRPDAVDPVTGERLTDVVVLWVGSESDKLALIQDPATPFFTTPHFDGHLSVLSEHRNWPGCRGTCWSRWSRMPGCHERACVPGRPGSSSTGERSGFPPPVWQPGQM